MAGWLPTVRTQQFLSDSFSGATVILSLTKEKSDYAGNCIQISRSNGSSQTTIGFTGTALDMTSLNTYLSGGTAFVDTWYDQSGNANDATSTTTKRWQIIVDTDGLPSLVTANSASGMEIADAASHKTTKIDLYFVGKIGETYNNSTDYWTVMAAWTPTGLAENVSRWAFMLSEGGFGDGLELPRNGTNGTRTSLTPPTTIPLGNGLRTNFAVWHYNSERLALRRNDTLLWDDVTAGNSSTANVTYSGTGKIVLGQNFDNTENSRGTFRAFVIYGTTRADHSSICTFLTNRWLISEFPTSYNSGDGWLWTPNYFPNFIVDASNDANGMRWWYEHGGYPDNGSRGPSFALASNVNNGVTFSRHAVYPGDSDTIVNGSERSERGGFLGASTEINKGDDWEVFSQFYIEAGASQTEDWCLGFQFHHHVSSTPDLMYISFKNDQFQVVSSRGGVDTNRGSPVGFSRDTWYAVRIKGKWSSGGTTDTLDVWLGANGGTLTQIVTGVNGSLFSTDDTSAYCKQGIYRGFPGANSGAFAIRHSNYRFSKTPGAYSSLVTTQPALPTHA